jgi:hypothetical protein
MKLQFAIENNDVSGYHEDILQAGMTRERSHDDYDDEHDDYVAKRAMLLHCNICLQECGFE